MPYKYKKVVMIGNPDSALFVDLAKEYKFCSDEIILVSRYRGSQTNYVDEKISFISTYENESFLFKLYLSFLARFLNLIVFFLSIFKNKKGKISIVEPFIQGISVSRYVNKLNDIDFVVAHNVFTYGLAALWCKKTIRVMRPWGGDVYQHALISKFHFKLVEKVLKKADIVDAISPALYNYLKSKFGLTANILLNASSSYIGAAEVIELHKLSSKKKTRRELGIPEDGILIVNARRLKEKWGSEEVLESFEILANKYENMHFVLLSGEGSEEMIALKKRIIREKGLEDRFTLFEKTVDLQTYVKIIFSSDIFFSLMHEADLRSASIMTGLHCDSLPVISNQAEYHEMIKEGAMMQIIDYKNIEEIIKATEKYLFDDDFKRTTLEANRAFIKKNIDNSNQFLPLMDKIDEMRK